MKPYELTPMEHLVYKTIRKYPKGCISDIVLRDLHYIGYSTITPRYKKLVDVGMIWRTGEVRPGASGRMQQVMKAV